MTSKFDPKLNTGSAIRVAALFFVISLGTSLLYGCESTGSKQALNTAVADYNAKNYLIAQRRSAKVAKSASGTLRDQAAYLAGLSAYKLGDFVEAELQLTKAVRSPDRITAARAKAVMGLIRVDQDRPGDAAGFLNEASYSMQGEDSRQAAYQAALAHEEAGSRIPDYASGQSKRGQTSQSWSSSNGVTAGRNTFSLQVGAFHERKRAETAAQKIAGVARANGLGNVRIVRKRDTRGRTLFIVQLGRFPNRFEAKDIHRQIGRKDLIVAPLAKPTL